MFTEDWSEHEFIIKIDQTLLSDQPSWNSFRQPLKCGWCITEPKMRMTVNSYSRSGVVKAILSSDSALSLFPGCNMDTRSFTPLQSCTHFPTVPAVRIYVARFKGPPLLHFRLMTPKLPILHLESIELGKERILLHSQSAHILLLITYGPEHCHVKW